MQLKATRAEAFLPNASGLTPMRISARNSLPRQRLALLHSARRLLYAHNFFAIEALLAYQGQAAHSLLLSSHEADEVDPARQAHLGSPKQRGGFTLHESMRRRTQQEIPYALPGMLRNPYGIYLYRPSRKTDRMSSSTSRSMRRGSPVARSTDWTGAMRRS